MIGRWILTFCMGLSLFTAMADDSEDLKTVGGNMLQTRNCRMGKVSSSTITRRFQSSNFLNRSQSAEVTSPYHGKRRQLVVLAQFADVEFQDPEPYSVWNRIFNEENFNEGSYKGSVHDYFYDQSYGRFDVSFDLFYVELPSSVVKYASSSIDDENSQFLVYDIVESLKQKDIDWGAYDWDSDGYADQLLIVFAGPGMNDGGGSKSIWPHQWWLSFHIDPNTQQPCNPCVVTDKQGQSFLIDCYCAVQERGRTASPFGTICHEYSHCFGFPDFYYGGNSYVGSWDVMDIGNYNGGGYRPCGYSAQERMYMGWLSPTELDVPTFISGMSSLSDQPEAYLVRNDGCSSEYYVIENRQQVGWDENLPGRGLLVFHINFDLDEWNGIKEGPNHPKINIGGGVVLEAQKHYYIIPANDDTSTMSSVLCNWAYPYGDNCKLTNTSFPPSILFNTNKDGSLLMNKPIAEMKVTNGLGSFSFMNGTSKMSHSTMWTTEPAVLYELGDLKIVRRQDGKVKKIMTKR